MQTVHRHAERRLRDIFILDGFSPDTAGRSGERIHTRLTVGHECGCWPNALAESPMAPVTAGVRPATRTVILRCYLPTASNPATLGASQHLVELRHCSARADGRLARPRNVDCARSSPNRFTSFSLTTGCTMTAIRIAPDLFRLSVYAPELDMQFSHFLVRRATAVVSCGVASDVSGVA